MQQLQRDQLPNPAQIMQDLTLADVVGYDVDSPFKQMMQFTISNDINHISVGGTSSLTQSVNFTCRLMEEGGLHDLMSYGIAFNVTLPSDNTHHYFFTNALTMFEAVYLKIGQKQIALAKHDIYQQLYLYSLNKAAVEPYAFGLGIDTQEYDSLYDVTAQGANQTTGLGYANIIKQKALQCIYRTNTVPAGVTQPNGAVSAQTQLGDNTYFVPLFLIVPELLTVDQQLYTSMGQTIEIGVRTQTYSKCIFNYEGLDNGSLGTYSISNISLVRQFSMLDSVHNDMIKRSELIIRPVQSMQFSVSPLSSSINLNFAISRGSKMRQLVFAFVPTNPGQGDGSVANLTAARMGTWGQIAAFNTTPGNHNFIWSPLSLFVALPIQQVEIDAAGDRVVFNSQQINVLQTLSGSQTHNTLGDFMDAYHGNSLVSGIEKGIKQVFRVDLDRFPIDDVGSTAQGQVQVLVKIVLNSSTVQQLLYVTGASNFANTFQNIADNLTCQAYLEFQDDIHIDHGIYR